MLTKKTLSLASILLVVLASTILLSACNNNCRIVPIICVDDTNCPENMICAAPRLNGIPIGTGICAYDNIPCGGFIGLCLEECLTCIDDPRDDCILGVDVDCPGVCAPGISGLFANSDNSLDNEANTSF
jgi:hypothetical protein